MAKTTSWSREHADYLEHLIAEIMRQEGRAPGVEVAEVLAEVRLTLIGLRRPLGEAPAPEPSLACGFSARVGTNDFSSPAHSPSCQKAGAPAPVAPPARNGAPVTYSKLKDGSWGIRGRGLAQGARVAVTRKDGRAHQETVSRVLWTGPDGVQLATIAPKEHAGNGARRRGDSCHTDGNCSSMCSPTGGCPCADGGWFSCC